MYRPSNLVDIFRSRDFHHFQLALARSWYSELVQGYQAKRNGEDEEILVERLVKVSNKSYPSKGRRRIKIASKFIHGHRSQIKYNDFNNGTHQCELGDMAVVSAVIENKKLLFQRLCFIQNKKGKHNRASITWIIDSVQLFLLKHFPAISGVSGILKGHKNIEFLNRSRCLGAYGLLYSPGEMIFVSAPVIADSMKGKKSINSRDIAFPPVLSHNAIWPQWYPYWCCGLLMPETFPPFYCGSRPICGNTVFTRDIYDFIMAWTQLNIGEILVYNGDVLDNKAYKLATAMIHMVLPGSIDGPPSDAPEVEIPDHDAGIGIFVYIIDISQQG